MGTPRPFCFGVQMTQADSAAAWTAKAQRAEALGYNILHMPDHLSGRLAWGPALATAAAATRTIRLGTFVLANDFRHPAFVAQEAATLDLLSGGRFELGIGAGWLGDDYRQSGIPLASPGVRVGRLEEAIQILKKLFGDEPVTFSGQHYTITELDGYPKPVQRPHPPFVIGGGGKRILEIAAREAATINLVPKSRPDGSGLDVADSTTAAFDQKLAWVRDAAGDRFPEIELGILLQRLIVTDDIASAVEALSHEWAPLTPDELRACPLVLAGSIAEIVETLQTRRQRWGLSSVVVFERDMESFAPIVSRLAGR